LPPAAGKPKRAVGSAEAGQADAAPVEPKIPLQLLPDRVERLPRPLPVSGADEQPPHPRHAARPTVTAWFRNLRLAVQPDFRVSLLLYPRERASSNRSCRPARREAASCGTQSRAAAQSLPQTHSRSIAAPDSSRTTVDQGHARSSCAACGRAALERLFSSMDRMTFSSTTASTPSRTNLRS
jgi:hypothetical protein